MLSAKTELSDKAELLSSGADDYLTKPYQLEELWASGTGSYIQTVWGIGLKLAEA